MKAVFKQRLLKAAEIVEKVPKDEFYMGQFFHDCGSPACVLGHYAVATKFRAIRGYVVNGVRHLKTPASDSMAHFGLDSDECHLLFSTRGCNRAKTGKQAAKYIRKFVERKYG